MLIGWLAGQHSSIKGVPPRTSSPLFTPWPAVSWQSSLYPHRRRHLIPHRHAASSSTFPLFPKFPLSVSLIAKCASSIIHPFWLANCLFPFPSAFPCAAWVTRWRGFQIHPTKSDGKFWQCCKRLECVKMCYIVTFCAYVKRQRHWFATSSVEVLQVKSTSNLTSRSRQIFKFCYFSSNKSYATTSI